MKVEDLIRRLRKANGDTDVKMTVCDYDIGDVIITITEDGTETVKLESAKRKTV